jgi:hypothetical protein
VTIDGDSRYSIAGESITMSRILRGMITLLVCCATVLVATTSAQAAYGPQLQVQGGASSDVRPALVRFGDRLFAIYKGRPDDPIGIFYTTSTDGVNWAPQQYLGAATSDSPAAAVFNGRLYVFYKSHSDESIWYKSSPDGANWTNELNHPLGGGGGSSDGPSVAVYQNQLHVVWKGIGDDQRIFTTTSVDGVRWTDQQWIARDGGTSTTPAVAAYAGVFVMTWKGIHDDTRIFWSFSHDGVNFNPQWLTVGNTSDGPALAASSGSQGPLYRAWKGVPGNQIFQALADTGLTWTDQWQVGGGTSDGPALAANNGPQVLAWKGVPGDNRLFYSVDR